jgi:hypothetical protein
MINLRKLYNFYQIKIIALISNSHWISINNVLRKLNILYLYLIIHKAIDDIITKNINLIWKV